LAVFPARSPAVETTAVSTPARVIRIGVLSDNYPYSFRDTDGVIKGFAFDLTAAVEQAMGLKVERVYGTTEEITAAFRNERVDLLQSYAQFPEREGEADFSVPWLNLAGTIFVRAGDTRIREFADLKGRKVLVHRGSLGEAVLRRAGMDASIVHADSVVETLIRLAQGEADATMSSRLSALSLAQRNGIKGLVSLDAKVPGYDVRYCMAVRKGDHELLAQVNEGLAILVRTGRFDEIYRKWFGHLEPEKYTATQVLGAVAIGLAMALMVAVWAAVNQRRLRRRLQLQEGQLRQKQKIEAVGTLARGVAHDFNNLLTAIMGNVELSLMGLPPDHPEAPGLKLALKASQRARDLVKQILTFSRQTEPKREVVALAPLVEETVHLLRTLAKEAVAFEIQLPTDLPSVLADPAQVHQVLMNLGTNAVQAMRGSPGRLSFSAEAVSVGRELRDQQVELDPGRYVRLAVQDTGPGMSEEVRRRIFEPFFTTKAPGEGTGLGLSVVHGIMEQHGGAVTLYTHPGRGSRFHLYFPAAGAVEEQSATVAGAGQRRGERILFVDDDVAVLDTGRKMFERLGYRVSVHIQAETALAEYRAGPAGFDLVFSDLTMPGMSGLQLLAAVRAIRASQPFILCSGIFSESDRQAAARQGVTLLLPKPLNFAALNEALAAVSSRS
jgi:signal transduction histidine kinase/ActR/RegA family two-component response regulator